MAIDSKGDWQPVGLRAVYRQLSRVKRQQEHRYENINAPSQQ